MPLDRPASPIGRRRSPDGGVAPETLPARTDVATIVKTCAGARVVVGVEGSGLAHGILGLAPGGSLLVLQPPDRFVTVYKNTVEREGQHFAFVVGQPRGDGFYVDPAEVERTLDLLPPARI